jgi:hypothetical protein
MLLLLLLLLQLPISVITPLMHPQLLVLLLPSLHIGLLQAFPRPAVL